MPWNAKDYPASFKNLEPEVREKAIEIANALLRDNYEENRAIPIATAKAREYVNSNEDKRPQYFVKPRDADWILIKDRGVKAIFAAETKKDLLNKAKPYVNNQNGVLIICHEDGSYEDTLYQ